MWKEEVAFVHTGKVLIPENWNVDCVYGHWFLVSSVGFQTKVNVISKRGPHGWRDGKWEMGN